MDDVYAARASHWWSDLWLRLIAFFKLLKATLLVAAGIGALGLLNPHTGQGDHRLGDGLGGRPPLPPARFPGELRR